MTVRGYRDEDRDACRGLWVELTQTHRDLYSAPEIGGDDPGSYFDEHLELVGPENVWVAERDGQVVGFTALIAKEKHAELEPIVVSGEHRGEGIGRALAETVISTAKERGMRQVIVRPVGRNADAIGFFHSRGFDSVGQIELILDLVNPDRWQAGERFAGRDFRV
jgi:N-acetylglutamate synthase-like GNAT family acetyltransferase